MYNKGARDYRFATAVLAALFLASTVISMTTTTEKAFAGKYEINQATSTSNSCLNPLFDSNTFDIAADIGNCGNTVSQQAEGGEASSPITVQTASPTIEVQAPPPVEPVEPQTCEECFTAFLTADEIDSFLELLLDIDSLEELCTLIEDLPPQQQAQVLDSIAVGLGIIGVDGPTIDEIIDCLERVLGQ